MTPSLKAQIEQQAAVYESHTQHEGLGPAIYIAGATPYAEKWEAATQYTDQLKEVLRFADCPELIIENPSFIKGKKPTDEDMKWAMGKVQEYIAEEESLKQENKRLREALERLVLLKQHKDIVGKDDYYKREQPLAWEQATEALKPKQ